MSEYKDIAEVADSFWPEIYNTIDETLQVCCEMEERDNDLWYKELSRQAHVVGLLKEAKDYIEERQKKLDELKADKRAEIEMSIPYGCTYIIDGEEFHSRVPKESVW